ncbi:Protein CBR-KLP-10 [Caenorhabditis briggsae]|uniref:Kinesin-like protein n=1 Tax=Caenorhabditis briggsae TaxID=6238 RepID=A8XRJ2_CAEBR|nr:Protein CBR-KLP-10 [Caenorhabditis briggsae]CAP35266.2 Protein CBR-KLP-10 [Caenorhabditis briggsae]
MSQFIKTYGRIRPSANGSGTSPLVSTDKAVNVDLDNGRKTYELHRIFNSAATQEDVFACVSKKIVEDSADGFNGTVFAYGQTGSGKTHTMLGPTNSWSDPEHKGLIPRSIEYLFELLDAKTREFQKFTFSVNVEFVELYNEEIYDLLNLKNKVQLRDLGKEIQLDGAKSETVDNSLDLMHVVQRGWVSRSTGSTAMNNESSRSHALLIIKIKTQEVTGGLVKERSSTLNLVDLAGSERQSHTKATGDRLKEATNINSSLTVLGRCIRILSKPTAGSYVPYRDSHLTHILKNSLGGNSKTAVIVNMHPDREFLAESTSTLNFAQSCALIKNAATRNEVMTGDQENSYKKAIQELRQEVDETRAKVREEFGKRLDDSEEMQRRLTKENEELKAAKIDLQSQIDLARVKYLFNGDAEQSLEEHKKLISSLSDKSASSLYTVCVLMHLRMFNIRTFFQLKLEKEASEKRCHQLQQDLNELRSKYESNLSETLRLQTPNGKVRQSSSRSERRQTLYKPSPATLANYVEESEVAERLDEANTMICKLESEKQTLQSKWETATESFVEAEKQIKELESSKSVLITEKEQLSKEFDAVRRENEENVEKISKNRKDLDGLLLKIAEYAKEIENRKQEKLTIEEKHGKEMDEEKSALQKELANKAQLLADAKNDIKECSKTSSELHSKIVEKSEMISTLKKKVEENDAELKIKADLIVSLEQDIAKKAELIKQQAAKLDENVTALSEQNSLKRRIEEAIEIEENWKKRYAALEDKLQTEFNDHQRDIKNLKAKKDAEIKEYKETLQLQSNMLKEQGTKAEKQLIQKRQEFDKKVEEMEQQFAQMSTAALKKQEEKIRRDSMLQYESTIQDKQDEITELKNLNEFYSKQHDEDSHAIANMMNTRQGKLSYVEKIRLDKMEQEKTIIQQRATIDRLSKGHREANRPVLRSRNQEAAPQ